MLGLHLRSPGNSPNTDGIDPESCADVEIRGVRFSLGDDCVAVKSGKRYMGDTYATPCERVRVCHCEMGDGHGAVTLGSEMSGGSRDVLVEDCDFHGTDRGLRIKTRRGRGKNAGIDCEGRHVAAAYFLGLPERPIGSVMMRDVGISFAENAEAGVPVMADGVEPCVRQGIMAENVGELRLENVNIYGAKGELLRLGNVLLCGQREV